MNFSSSTNPDFQKLFASPAFLAPMSGISDLAMRRTAAKFGAGLVVCEMTPSHHLVSRQIEAQMRIESEGVGFHAVQLAGREKSLMREAAIIVEANGADLIDLNMGCPCKSVTGGAGGAALMRDLDLAQGLVETIVAAVRVPVSVKMRLGWDEQSLNGAELARRAEQSGAAMITVHARTRQQFYKGKALWSRVKIIRDATSLPLVVNGDIYDLPSAEKALAASCADAVMVGRAGVGQPWLVGQIAEGLNKGILGPVPTNEQCHVAICAHLAFLLERMGQGGVRHARKHLSAYARFKKASTSLHAQLVREENPIKIEALLKQISFYDIETGDAA